jgi:hypothetical protein
MISIAIMGFIIISGITYTLFLCKYYHQDYSQFHVRMNELIWLRLLICTKFFVIFQETNVFFLLLGAINDAVVWVLASLYNIIIWVFLILIVNGWMSYRNSFDRNRLRQMMLIFLFIVLFSCCDYFFDQYITKIGQMLASDLKNILFNFFLTVICVKSGCRSRKILKNALALPLYIAQKPSLMMKIYVVTYLPIALIFYYISLLILIFVQTFLFEDYPEYFRFTLKNGLDTFYLMIFVVILKPQKLPPNTYEFNEELVDLPNVNIYSLSISSDTSNCNEEENEFTKPIPNNKISKANVKEVRSDKQIPIMVLNPTFESDDEQMTYVSNKRMSNASQQIYFHIIDKLCIGVREN